MTAELLYYALGIGALAGLLAELGDAGAGRRVLVVFALAGGGIVALAGALLPTLASSQFAAFPAALGIAAAGLAGAFALATRFAPCRDDAPKARPARRHDDLRLTNL